MAVITYWERIASEQTTHMLRRDLMEFRDNKDGWRDAWVKELEAREEMQREKERERAETRT